MEMNKKGQAALEYLLTYGWAPILVAILISIFIYILQPPQPAERWQEEWQCTPDDWREAGELINCEDKIKTQTIQFIGMDFSTNKEYCEKKLYVHGETEEGIMTYDYVFEPEINCVQKYDRLNDMLYDQCRTERLEIKVTTYPDGQITRPDNVYVMEDNNGKIELRELWSYEKNPPEHAMTIMSFECNEAIE